MDLLSSAKMNTKIWHCYAIDQGKLSYLSKTYIFVIEFVFLKTKVSVMRQAAYYRRMNMAFIREKDKSES